jgi:hypothetical protein
MTMKSQLIKPTVYHEDDVGDPRHCTPSLTTVTTHSVFLLIARFSPALGSILPGKLSESISEG